MAKQPWWQSVERIHATFLRARIIAIVFGASALVSFLMQWPAVLGGLLSLVATTAATITLFTWFRHDDLARTEGQTRTDDAKRG